MWYLRKGVGEGVNSPDECMNPSWGWGVGGGIVPINAWFLVLSGGGIVPINAWCGTSFCTMGILNYYACLENSFDI